MLLVYSTILLIWFRFNQLVICFRLCADPATLSWLSASSNSSSSVTPEGHQKQLKRGFLFNHEDTYRILRNQQVPINRRNINLVFWGQWWIVEWKKKIIGECDSDSEQITPFQSWMDDNIIWTQPLVVPIWAAWKISPSYHRSLPLKKLVRKLGNNQCYEDEVRPSIEIAKNSTSQASCSSWLFFRENRFFKE